MVASKGGGDGGGGGGDGVPNIIQPITSECCMCGDYGLSQELFRCKICKFRSQHKYCSNQYPKAGSYKACNWCLTQKHDSGNSSNSSSSCRNNSGDDHRDHALKNKRTPNGHEGLRERRRASEIQLANTAPIKKLHGSSAEEESPVSTGRKRVGGGAVEEKNRGLLRKSKSANHISNGGGGGGGGGGMKGGGGGGGGGGMKTRHVFRSKVRRYKLLDEVSIQ